MVLFLNSSLNMDYFDNLIQIVIVELGKDTSSGKESKLLLSIIKDFYKEQKGNDFICLFVCFFLAN